MLCQEENQTVMATGVPTTGAATLVAGKMHRLNADAPVKNQRKEAVQQEAEDRKAVSGAGSTQKKVTDLNKGNNFYIKMPVNLSPVFFITW
jgi:hypothetical protein